MLQWMLIRNGYELFIPNNHHVSSRNPPTCEDRRHMSGPVNVLFFGKQTTQVQDLEALSEVFAEGSWPLTCLATTTRLIKQVEEEIHVADIVANDETHAETNLLVYTSHTGYKLDAEAPERASGPGRRCARRRIRSGGGG